VTGATPGTAADAPEGSGTDAPDILPRGLPPRTIE
jgi:hypothetical protein